MRMPIIGPRMTALGDTDFISAQTSAARQISPRSGEARWPAVISMTPTAASRLPARGTRRLCRKLPTTISTAAQRLPYTAARRQDAGMSAAHRATFFPASHENSAQRVGFCRARSPVSRKNVSSRPASSALNAPSSSVTFARKSPKSTHLANPVLRRQIVERRGSGPGRAGSRPRRGSRVSGRPRGRSRGARRRRQSALGGIRHVHPSSRLRLELSHRGVEIGDRGRARGHDHVADRDVGPVVVPGARIGVAAVGAARPRLLGERRGRPGAVVEAVDVPQARRDGERDVPGRTPRPVASHHPRGRPRRRTCARTRCRNALAHRRRTGVPVLRRLLLPFARSICCRYSSAKSMSERFIGGAV